MVWWYNGEYHCRIRKNMIIIGYIFNKERKHISKEAFALQGCKKCKILISPSLLIRKKWNFWALRWYVMVISLFLFPYPTLLNFAKALRGIWYSNIYNTLIIRALLRIKSTFNQSSKSWVLGLPSVRIPLTRLT